MKAAGKVETRDNILAHFVQLVRENLHVVLAFSPGKSFQLFPMFASFYCFNCLQCLPLPRFLSFFCCLPLCSFIFFPSCCLNFCTLPLCLTFYHCLYPSSRFNCLRCLRLCTLLADVVSSSLFLIPLFDIFIILALATKIT